MTNGTHPITVDDKWNTPRSQQMLEGPSYAGIPCNPLRNIHIQVLHLLLGNGGNLMLETINFKPWSFLQDMFVILEKNIQVNL